MAKKITDIGAKETDEVLDSLEERIAKEYAQAEAEIQEKLDTYLQKFEIKDSLKQKAVENGQITQEDYEKWRVAQIATGENWAEMRDSIAEDLTNTAELAALTTNETMPEVYAINHNYGTYQIEQLSGVDTSYTLYNKEAVANLFDDDFDFYPEAGKITKAKIKAGEQLAWDKKNIQSVMIQSLLQGESIGNIATRLAKATGESDRKVAIRNARTLTTSVQNAGRLDSYQRAKDKGINVKKQWIATLDNRTRHEHRILDGQVQDLGDPFTVAGYELSYPADPNATLSQKLRMQKAGNVIQGPAFLIYNCRCTILGVLEGHEIDVTDLSQRNASKMDEDSYEEWKESRNIQSEPITKQDEIAETMQKAYIDEYKSYANGGKWYKKDTEESTITTGAASETKKTDTKRTEITTADWASWAEDPEPYKAAVSGTKMPTRSQADGHVYTSAEKKRATTVGKEMQRRASTETVNESVLYRGESYASLKEAEKKYKVGDKITNSTLTSYTTQIDIAQEYANYGEDTGQSVKVVIQNIGKLSGSKGITTDPLGVGGSYEVISPMGLESEVTSTWYDEETETLFVTMINGGEIKKKKKR